MSEALLQMVYEHNERVGAMLWTREDKVRFAELIVKECVEVVKWTPSQFPNDEYVNNIKEHFGVE